MTHHPNPTRYRIAIDWLRHNGCLTAHVETMTHARALERIIDAESYYQHVLANPEATRSELEDAQLDVLEAEFVAMAVANRPDAE